ncbi:hypothetical protein, partial [Roseibium sp.]|uniref:hypothetical protein n=1 Tax=Roseibium sp. TaxID=1936156 RepID=UPI0025DE8822
PGQAIASGRIGRKAEMRDQMQPYHEEPQKTHQKSVRNHRNSGKHIPRQDRKQRRELFKRQFQTRQDLWEPRIEK